MHRILVIEDEPVLQDLISEILANASFKVLLAENGQIGLRVAKEKKPDLILCDIAMPNLDGYGVLKALRQDISTATIPFIFLTAMASKPDMRRGMLLGADDYVTKPFCQDELLKTIAVRLEKQALLEKAHAHNAKSAMDSQQLQAERIAKALEKGEFLLHYQPQISLQTEEIFGAEVLVRWRSPELGMISPAEFIPVAEETGLIVPLGEWVLHTACLQAKAWQKAGLPPLQIAVNLSSLQFNQTDLIPKISHILSQTELEVGALELELTESMLVQNVETTKNKFQELKALGIQIAIDDFGTGYASLGYLQHFPFDTLKIDQCFVRNIDQNAKNSVITTALIHMAHDLQLTVVAEGVETASEKHFLTQHQCDGMQGYFFSRPLPATEFEKLLKQHIAIPNMW
jgi:EAL domain-containing protein (putative c-di-GMP-specific phosphodiesterase class I)